jgi:molecular chaperone GrpE
MSYYDRSRHNPRYQPTRRFTHSQIKQIEATLQELQQEAAKWKETARKWEAVAREEHQRANQLEEQLQELQNTSGQPPEGLKSAQAVDEVEIERTEAGGRITQLEEQLARAQADYENAKTRLRKRFAQQFEQEMQAFLRELLPVLDNLDRAIQHNPVDANAEGVKMTRQMFLSTLDKYGVVPTAVLGQPFDPEYHEALGIVDDSDLPPGSVAAVEQPGYTYRDKLLRPARVLVTPEE